MSLPVEVRERVFAYKPEAIAREFVNLGIINPRYVDHNPISFLADHSMQFKDDDLGTVVVALTEYEFGHVRDQDKRLALYEAAERKAGALRIAIAKDSVLLEIKNFPFLEEEREIRTRTLRRIIELQAKLLEEATIIVQKEVR